MTTIQLIAELSELGIDAQRRTIYTDIDAMIVCGYRIDKQRRNRDIYYRVEHRQFDIPELKILMDAVQSSKFIPENKSEELFDKIANYNACRTPWRIGMDGIMNKNPTEIRWSKALSSFIKQNTASDPWKIIAGYDLNGKAVSD